MEEDGEDQDGAPAPELYLIPEAAETGVNEWLCDTAVTDGSHELRGLTTSAPAVQDIFQALCDAAALNPDSASEGGTPSPLSTPALSRAQQGHAPAVLQGT